MVSMRELKQERSIPVQGRVDVMVLADIAVYAYQTGIRLHTMSSLVSYATEVARVALEKAGLLKDMHGTVSEAYEVLNTLGLLKGRTLGRARQKLNTAIEFENLRAEGIDPEFYTPTHFNTMHNSNSVKPVKVELKSKVEEMVEIYKELERRDNEKRFEAPPNPYAGLPKDTILGPLKPEPRPAITPITQAPEYKEPTNKINNSKYKDLPEDTLNRVYEAYPELKPKEKRTRAEIGRKNLGNAIRTKTDEEVDREFERIAEKDKALANMDMTSAALKK